MKQMNDFMRSTQSHQNRRVVAIAIFTLLAFFVLWQPKPSGAVSMSSGLSTYIFHNSNNNDSSYYFGDKSNIATWFETVGGTNYASAQLTRTTTNLGSAWSMSQYYNTNNTTKTYNAADQTTVEYYSVLFLGYIKPTTASSAFYLRTCSDDGSLLFFGNNAKTGATYSVANASVNNNFLQGTTCRGTANLGAVNTSTYYPLRVEFGEWGGGDVVYVEYSTDNATWSALPSSWTFNTGASVTTDTTAPATPGTPTLTVATDTGVSTTDGITGASQPVLTGTAEADSTVTIYSSTGANACTTSGTQVGTATATGGTWSYTLASNPGATATNYCVTASDSFNNVSGISASKQVRGNYVTITTNAAGAQTGVAFITQPVVNLTDGGTATVTMTSSLGTPANNTALVTSGTGGSFSGTSLTYTSGSLAGATLTYAATGYISATQTLSAIPSSVTVATGTTDANGVWLNNTWYTSTSGASNITPTDLASAINTASRSVYAFGGVTITNAVTATSSGKGITFAAGSDVVFNANFTTSAGVINAYSDSDNSGEGGIKISASVALSSQGGNITLAGGDTSGSGYSKGSAAIARASGGWSGFYLLGSISSGVGNIVIRSSDAATTYGSNYSSACELIDGSSIVSTDGSITMNCIVPSTQTSTTVWHDGIIVGNEGGGTNPTITSGSGNISITGDTSASAYASRIALGLYGTTISSTSGAVTLTESSSVSNSNAFHSAAANTVSSTNGSVTVNGSSTTTLAENFTSMTFNSGTTTTLNAYNPTFSSTTFGGTGRVIIQSPSGRDSFSAAITTANMTFGASVSGLQIGAATNNVNVTISNALSIAGPITVYGATVTQSAATQATTANGSVTYNAKAGISITGGITSVSSISLIASGSASDVTIQASSNLTTTATSGIGVLVKSASRIYFLASITTQTSGADIVMWSDTDSSGEGAQYYSGSDIFKSQGGDIVFGGGPDDGGTANPEITGHVAGDQKPDGYAAGYSGWGANGGIDLITGYQLLSGGGNISLAGRGSATTGDDDYGVLLRGGMLYSAGGKIAVWAKAPGTCDGSSRWHRGIGISWAGDGGSGDYIVSTSTASDAITMSADMSTCNAGSFTFGIESYYSAGTTIATPNGGGISLTGSQGSASGYNGAFNSGNYQESNILELNYVNVLSNSGPITLRGTWAGTHGNHAIRSNARGTAQYNYFGASPSAISTGNSTYSSINITSSTSNVTFTGDSVVLWGANLKNNGNLTIEPVSASFDRDQYFSSGWGVVYSTTYKDVRIGKPGTSGANQTSSNYFVDKISATGDIAMYGGTINLYYGVTTSENSGNGILIKATQDIVLSDGTSATHLPITITGSSSTAPIYLWSNADASGTGAVKIGNYTDITSQGGAISIGGSSSANDTEPTSYAVNNSSTYTCGVKVGSSSVSDSNVTMTSNGGAITVRGKSTYDAYNAMGILGWGGWVVDSGSGAITIDAYENGATGAANGHAIELNFGSWKSSSFTSSKSSGTAISITGTVGSGSTSSNSRGVVSWSGTSLTLNASGGGNVNITGRVSGSTSQSISLNYTTIKAAGGNITLDGGTKTIDFGQEGTYTDTNTVGGPSSGSKAASVTVKADTILLPTSQSTVFQNANNVSLLSSSNSFAAATTIPSTTAFNSVGALQIGSNTNTRDITLSGSNSIAGNLDVFGGKVIVGASQTTTNLGDLSIKADDFSFTNSATLNAAGVATITPTTNSNQINIGAADSSGTLGISTAELSAITASKVRIGAKDGTNTGNITVSANLAPTTFSTLALRTAGSVTEGSNTITVANLGVLAGGNISLAGNNNVTTLALNSTATSPSVSYTETASSNYSVARVDLIDPKFGYATSYSITTQPPSPVYVNTAFSSATVVKLKDAYNNEFATNNATQNTVVASSNNAGIVLGGITSITQTASDFVFDGLLVTDGTGTLVITFSDSAVVDQGSVSSNSIEVLAGDPDHLTLVSDAAGCNAGLACVYQPAIQIEDANGHVVTREPGGSLRVTATLTSGTGTLIGTAYADAIDGVATFSNLGIAGSTSNSYTITYSATFATNSPMELPQPVTIGAGTITRLELTAPSYANNAVALSDAPMVSAFDYYNNLVDNSDALISLQIEGATLTGATEANLYLGTASFVEADVRLVGLVGSKSLTASVNVGEQTITSNAVEISLGVGPAKKIAIVTQPSGGNAVRQLLAVQPCVEIRDAGGNLVTEGADASAIVTINIHNDFGAGRGDLDDGDVTASARNGVAQFSGVILSRAKANNDYNFDFSANLNGVLVTSAASSKVQVTHGAPAKIVLLSGSATGEAGVAFLHKPVVAIQDLDGNTVTDGEGANAEVTVSVDHGSITGSNSAATATQGIAEFVGLGVGGMADGYTLTFSISSPCQDSFTQSVSISHGPADHIEVKSQPTSSKTGDELSTIVAWIVDAYGNLVTDSSLEVTAALTNPANPIGSELLTGNSATALGGVATFSHLTVVTVPGSKTLTFSANNLTSGDSEAILFKAANASKLVITRQPAGGNSTGDALYTQPKVEVRDRFGNLVSDSTVEITVSIASGSGGNLSEGSITASSENGIATFSGVVLVGKPHTNYTLLFSAGGLATATSDDIQVVHGAAYQLIIKTQPKADVTGTVLTDTPVVAIADRYGNTLDDNNSIFIDVDVHSGTGATLTGDQSVKVVNGLASFTNLALTGKPGVDYTLSFTSGSYISATSDSISVVAGPATKLAVVNQPVGAVTGKKLQDQPSVELLDFYGNRALAATGTEVTVSLGQDDGHGELGGTLTATSENGLVVFTNVTLKGTPLYNYTLVFSSDPLTSTESESLHVTHDVSAQLVITTQPVGAKTGDVLKTQPVLKLYDQYGNLATTDNSTVVTASITVDDGDGSLENATVTVSEGVARFSDLTLVGTPGFEYKLGFAFGPVSARVVSSNSNIVKVTHAASYRLVVVTQPTTRTMSGWTLGPSSRPSVQVRDRFGNVATSDNTTQVVVSVCAKADCPTSSDGGSVSGTTTVTAVNGVVDFDNIAVSGSVGLPYKLRFKSVPASALQYATSSAITLSKVADLNVSYPTSSWSASGKVAVTASTDSTEAISYSVSEDMASMCSVNASTGEVTIIGVGVCNVHAEVAGTDNYLAASTDVSFTIDKATPSALSLTNSTSTNYMQTLPLVVASSGVSEIDAAALSFSTVGTCQVVAGVLVPGDAGSTCKVTAVRAETTHYKAASSSQVVITVNKVSQATLTLVNPTTTQVGSLDLVTIGGSGNGEVSFSIVSSGTAGCSVSGAKLSATASGTCSVKAVKATSTNYNAIESATQVITATKLSQAVTFTSIVPTLPIVNGTYAYAATASSGLAVTYAVTSGSGTVCQIAARPANTLTFLAVGTCVITATQAGNAAYNSDAASQTIVVGSTNQTISWPVISDKQFGTAAFMLAATTNSGLPISYSIGSQTTTNQVDGQTIYSCSVTSAGVLTINMAGECAVLADQAGNSNYLAAPQVERIFTITPVQAGSPTILSVSGGKQSATILFTQPSYTGGDLISGYQMVATAADGTETSNSACDPTLVPLSCTVDGLDPTVTYTVKVAAITSAGIGAYSIAAPIPVTPVESPTSVSNVTANAVNGSIDVQWDQPLVFNGDFLVYDIYVTPRDSAFPSSPTRSVTQADLTNVQIPESDVLNSSPLQVLGQALGLVHTSGAGSSGYDLKIVTRTTNDPNESAQNTTSTATITASVPGAPTALTVTGVGADALISWAQPLNDGGSAVLDYTVSINGSVVCASVTSTSCMKSPLSSIVVNTITVTARNAIGSSSETSATYGTVPPPKPTPTPTPTPSDTATPTPTPTPTPSDTPTPTPTPSDSPSDTPTPTPSDTPSETPTPTPSDTTSPSPSASPSATQSALPVPQPSTIPPVITAEIKIPQINPGQPVPNPAIGATGDDNAPPAPFDPLASPQGVVALTQTTGSIAAVAGSVAAAAAAAAAGAAAAGAAAAAGGAAAAGASAGAGAAGGNAAGGSGGSSGGSGGGSSGGDGGDGGSVANIDTEHEDFTDLRRGRGDRWRIWRRRWMKWLDKPSLALIHALAKFSPLFTRIVEDGAYLRAGFGVFAIIPTLASAGLAIASLVINAGVFVTPPWYLFLIIAIIGIFDTFAGLIGTLVFVLGSLMLGAGGELNHVRMLLGVIIVGYGPALLANAFRAFRKVTENNTYYWWERIVDLAVLPFIGGWVTSSMISTLPALAGVTLAVANHVADFAFFIAIAIAGRVLLEELAGRVVPERLNYLHPSEVQSTHGAQRWISLGLRLAVFVFVTSALMGNDWRIWMGSVLFVVPTVIGFYADKFPNFPWLWRILPNGIPGLAFTLVVASLTTNLVGAWFGASPELALWSFGLLPIPMLGLTILHILGRDGLPDEERWIKRPRLRWLYRIGGIFMLLLTMKLAGVI